MKIPNLAYDLCRDYINDNSASLPAGVLDKLNGWIRSRRFELLAEATSLLPKHSHDRETYRILRQVRAFFCKNAAFSVARKCLQAAKDSFVSSEATCKLTNERLDAFDLDRDLFGPDIKSQVSRMEAYIASVLGSYDDFLGQLPSLIKVTSGATATRSRRSSLPYLKVSKKISCTAACEPYLSALSQFYGYGPMRVSPRVSNRVEFVPKNWKTHRTIACEPDGNIPLQLAFDTYAKRRLMRFRINLRDQSFNQELARIGSLTGLWATVDLSAASDTVAYNAVWLVFPAKWAAYLTDIRSSHYRLDGITHKYEKFSSMGNGSTFAVETLLFAAACYAVGSKGFSVYGDDIAIESAYFEDLERLLAFLGFSINSDKSFTSGPFRESCGADWFEGIDITPFYLRNEKTAKSDLCHVVNSLASRCNPDGLLEKRLLSLVRDHNLPIVPFSGDSRCGIEIDITSAYRSKKIRVRNGATFTKRFTRKNKSIRVENLRTYFLWHLSCNGRLFSVNTPLESSRVPTQSYKHALRWVHWLPPVRAVPIHLFRWSDLVCA